MKTRSLALVLALATPVVPRAAQSLERVSAAVAPRPAAPRADTFPSRSPGPAPTPSDTILRHDLSRPPLSVRSGLAALPGARALRLGLRRIPLAVDTLLFPPVLPGAEALTLEGALARRAESAALLAAVLRDRVSEWGAPRADSSIFLPPVQPAGEAVQADTTLPFGGLMSQYANLAVQVKSRMELGGSWASYRPCDVQFKVGCNPGAIPQISPDAQFGVKIQGSIADRIHVDVDFDQSREYDAANRINIFYQGKADDILQRLEVGDVTFNLPASRFLTEGIPSGNFGFQAEGQLGPLDFQTVWAQQRGNLNSREFHLTGVGDQRAFVQDDTLALDDAEYVKGQFFFLVDPSLIRDYPYIDVLNLDASAAPPSVEPGPEPIQLYRYENDPVQRQQVEGYIQADASATKNGQTVTESGWFRYLQPGVDYYVHPSGLWIALKAPLAKDEMLAVTYITATGDTVGDYNPERIANAGGRPKLRLLKASAANQQPGMPTWDMEMHQVYRVSGSRDVDPGSVNLTISLGELSAGRTFKRGPTGQDLTFLRLFGLDAESPADQLDPSFVFTPASSAFSDQPPVEGTFLVFPTLHPFAEPPPLPSRGLTAEETARILGEDANHNIYDQPDPYERAAAGLFRLTLTYRIRSQGVISSFSLGAIGIRDGSERIYLGNRLLTRGVDYTIDYDVGQVRLLDPEQLFISQPNATVRATWEQRSLFQISPTQVFGMRAHADLGKGGINVLGLYQAERTVLTRPTLGTEPAAVLTGGVSGDYSTGVAWMDRVLNRMPGLRFTGHSNLSVNGEVALSVPNPNTKGEAFLDDFDAADELPISLLSSAWMLGSAPGSTLGAEAVLPGPLGVSNAGALVWQHSWVELSQSGDSVGVHEGYLPQSDIDHQIRVAGSEMREPGLMLTFTDPHPGQESWRSVTTSLSSQGLDLTRTEYLEFYAAGGKDETLVIDLGAVSEDAFFIDSAGHTSGTRPSDGRQWGLGVLDQEADPAQGQIWSDALDQLGLWDESCLAHRGRIYRIGDPRADCTRGNGRRDSEDLDGDGNLDLLERHLRFVVKLGSGSPYLARTTDETGTAFQLYRIPIQGAGAVQVGGAFTDADLRAVKDLRVTVASTQSVQIQIARMRFVGSRWLKRAADGVLRGMVGDTLADVGRLEVGEVSKVTEGNAYTSPPGVLEQLQNPTSAFSGQGIEFNEKSLGLTFQGVPTGGRAEVYERFPQRPRNFLAYRQMRLWVAPRSGDFGPDRPHWFFFKVGTDADNFYLFRAKLPPAANPAGVTAGDWSPEMVIDFGEWFDLRRRAEEALLLSSRSPTDPPVMLWSADSAYAVVLSDRGRAPNLAAVRELSMGVWNLGDAPTSGEVWVDELRLSRPVRDPGVAGSFQANLNAAGVFDAQLSVTDRGAFFHQLHDDPSYQADREVNLVSTVHMERWMPSGWGVDLPLTFSMDRMSQNPTFLTNSDVRADELTNLRPTDATQTRIAVGFRKTSPSANPVVGFFVDGIDARLSYTSVHGSTVTTKSNSGVVEAGLGWTRNPVRRDLALVPSFATDLIRTLLPGSLGRAVLGARLRWSPERISIGTSYVHTNSRIFRYDAIIERPGDTLVVPTLAPRETVQSAADVRFRPLESLSADFTMLTTRDLLSPAKAVSEVQIQDLLSRQHTRIGGVDLGWETNRNLQTRLAWQPRFVDWLRQDFNWSTAYSSNRNANYVAHDLPGPDSVALARNANGQRNWQAVVSLDPGLLTQSALGEPASDGGPDPYADLRAVTAAIQPLTVTYRDGISSSFERDPVAPGADYQLGWGGMDAFRLIEGDTAATLTDRASWTMRSGFRLPGGMGIDVGWEHVLSTTLDTRSDRSTREEHWPDVHATLPTLTFAKGSPIQRVSLSSGLVRTSLRTVYGGRALQERTEGNLQVPVQLSVTWLGSLVTSYVGNFHNGRGSDPTGDTEEHETTHRVAVTSIIAAPASVSKMLDRPIKLSLLAGYTAQRDCRSTASRPECVAFVDQLRRSLSLTLDTSVNGFEMGLEMSYDDRQSYIGQQTGSTQLRVGLYGQLQFSSGTFPAATGAS